MRISHSSRVSGFYTIAILKSLNIVWFEGSELTVHVEDVEYHVVCFITPPADRSCQI